MFLADVTLAPKGTARFSLFAVGDLHADSKSFSRERCAAWIDKIASHGPGAIAICVGDYLNGQTPGHKHFDPEATRADYLVNMDSYVKHGLADCERLFAPLKQARVPMVMVEGNHDRMMGAVGFTPMLADRVGAQFLGSGGFVRIRSASATNRSKTRGDSTTVVYAHHGAKGGATPGPKVNAMHAMMGWIDADVFVAGHVHDADTRVVHRYSVARRGGTLGIAKSPVALYRAPSFLERAPVGFSTYADRKEYGTADEGLMWIEIDPHHNTMQRHEFLPPMCEAA